MRDAIISAVSPRGSASFGSAPAFSRLSMRAALPFRQASESGVDPSRLATFTLARRGSTGPSWRGHRGRPPNGAPSPHRPGATFTSAFCASSARTAALSPRMTASATSLRAAPRVTTASNQYHRGAGSNEVLHIHSRGLSYKQRLRLQTSSSRPVLSPMLSWWMSNLSSTLSSRFPLGTVLLGYAR